MIAILTCVDVAQAAERLPWLSVDTERRILVDEDGKEARLVGFNLGSWLVQEIWMFPLEARKAPEDYEGHPQARFTDVSR